MIMKRWGQHILILVCLSCSSFFYLLSNATVLLSTFFATSYYDPSHRHSTTKRQNAFITIDVCLCIGFYIVCIPYRARTMKSHSHQIKIIPTSLLCIQIYAPNEMRIETWDGFTLDIDIKENKRSRRQIYCLYFSVSPFSALKINF